MISQKPKPCLNQTRYKAKQQTFVLAVTLINNLYKVETFQKAEIVHRYLNISTSNSTAEEEIQINFQFNDMFS